MDTRQEFLKDILSTALYGIGYWADVRTMADDDNECVKSSRFVYDMDDPSTKWRFDADLVEIGIAKVLSPGFLIADEVLKSILWANHMNDAGEIDIIGADVIIQAATLGEIVYG